MRPVLVGGVEVFAGRGNVFYGACLREAVGVGEGVTGDGAADEKKGPRRAMCVPNASVAIFHPGGGLQRRRSGSGIIG